MTEYVSFNFTGPHADYTLLSGEGHQLIRCALLEAAPSYGSMSGSEDTTWSNQTVSKKGCVTCGGQTQYRRKRCPSCIAASPFRVRLPIGQKPDRETSRCGCGKHIPLRSGRTRCSRCVVMNRKYPARRAK